MMTTDQSLTPEQIRKYRVAKCFSTGQVAKICKVSPRTVTKWIDAPDHRYFLTHETYRLPPTDSPTANAPHDGHDRRVTRAGLIRFLTVQGMFPHLAVLQGMSRILYAGSARAACQDALGSVFDVIPVDCAFDLARLIKRDAPGVVIIDFENPGDHLDPRAACIDIRKHFQSLSAGGPRIFGLCIKDDADQELVDDFVLLFDNFPDRVRMLMPTAKDHRLAG